MTVDTGFSCTEEALALHRPVGSLSLTHRTMVSWWLAVHGLDAERIALDRPVHRDVQHRVLRWHEPADDGPVVRTRHLGRDRHPAPWPLPFPVDLLGPSEFVDADGFTITPR